MTRGWAREFSHVTAPRPASTLAASGKTSSAAVQYSTVHAVQYVVNVSMCDRVYSRGCVCAVCVRHSMRAREREREEERPRDRETATGCVRRALHGERQKQPPHTISLHIPFLCNLARAPAQHIAAQYSGVIASSPFNFKGVGALSLKP